MAMPPKPIPAHGCETPKPFGAIIYQQASAEWRLDFEPGTDSSGYPDVPSIRQQIEITFIQAAIWLPALRALHQHPLEPPSREE